MPEFLREGSAIGDTLKPQRIIIGTQTPNAKKELLKLHQDFPGERLTTDIITAQMIKYTANAFLATKISFANAIARICDLIGADVEVVMKGIGLDSRIGPAFLKAGLGYGGSCFPKDINGLYKLSQNAGYQFKLLNEVEAINQTQPHYLIQKVQKSIGKLLTKKVAILGLAFKPNTDDIREAKSIDLISLLLKLQTKIIVYDPVAIPQIKKIFGSKIAYADSIESAIKSADIVMFVTEWQEFKDLDFTNVKKLMKGNLIVDARNMFNPESVKQTGLRYVGIGRK